MATYEKEIPENYEQAVAYIEDLPRFTKKHTLDHTRQFLQALGNPGTNRKVIHVAGTNGKGSVCAYMQAIIEVEGKRCGFFTSPHLVSINERIQIDRTMIDDDTFYQVFVKTWHAVKRMEEAGLSHPSYFEFLFGMGMVAFEEADVEYIILETGLGGRLDATNAIEHPFLTVITSISLDHTDILGDTIEKIAYEKAGIIKPEVPVFYDGSNDAVSQVIEQTAKKQHALAKRITDDAYEICEVDWNHVAFLRKNAYDKDTIWNVPICGRYQVMNAELALEAMEYALVADTNADIEREKNWADAIASIRWEGRMERIAPHLIIDGAHNPGALEAFADSIHLLCKKDEEPPVIIFSAVSDKKYEKMIEYLCHEVPAKAYIVIAIDDKRGVPITELKEIFQRNTDLPVYQKDSIRETIETAYEIRGDGQIFCLGSLYLVGMVKQYLAGGETHVGF